MSPDAQAAAGNGTPQAAAAAAAAAAVAAAVAGKYIRTRLALTQASQCHPNSDFMGSCSSTAPPGPAAHS
jgi:outer membrane lipoprotein SlyB